MKKIMTVIILITFLSALLMFISGVWAAYVSAESALCKSLRDETLLAADLLNNQSDFEKLSGGERISVIDGDGNVLFDSEGSSENHADREEVQAAFADSPKIVKRYSETTGSDMYYYAVKKQLENGQTVAVRLAVKSASVNEYLNISLPVFALVLVIVTVLSVIAGKYVANKFGERMKEINKSLKSLADGSFVPAKADSRELRHQQH